MLKHDLRKKYLQLRSDFSAQVNESISCAIIKNLHSKFELKDKIVSCFVPITRFNEINTWSILNDKSIQVAIPLIKNDRLNHIVYKGSEYLKPNNWGILEPTNVEDTIQESRFDIVIVPLLTINKKGYRVGYGKGYYDKFLNDCSKNCLFVGVYQFEEIEQIDDVNSFDVPLHYCVTPSQVLTF